MSVDPSNTFGSHPLHVALIYQFSAKMIQVEVGMESRSQNKHLVKFDHVDLLGHLVDFGVGFQADTPDLIHRFDQICLLFAIANHVLHACCQEEVISLEARNRSFQECAPIQSLRSRVLTVVVEELLEQVVSFFLSFNQVHGVGE